MRINKEEEDAGITNKNKGRREGRRNCLYSKLKCQARSGTSSIVNNNRDCKQYS